MTISLETEEGGAMEDVEAVCALRAATAVFRYEGGTWTSDGRAIFNMNPAGDDSSLPARTGTR